MSSLYESIKQGLNEAIEYERGNAPETKVDKIMISPLRDYTSDEIKEIRTQQKMSQRIFSDALGVSVKTVEAWEAGTNKPSGIACRMLELLIRDNQLFQKNAIVARQ